MTMRRISVFCGSKPGTKPEYADAAKQLGLAIAARGLTLVYGGGSGGLMGAVADAALDAGGEAIGVVPDTFLPDEFAHPKLTDVRAVGSLAERIALMIELSDAMVALPGGYGTLNEIVEAVTLAQLGSHQKPCALLNVDGYYDKLVGFLDDAVSQGFLRDRHRAKVLVANDPEAVLDELAGC